MGIYKQPTQNAIQKQLGATLTAGASTLTLSEDISSLFSGISSDNPVEFVIDRIDTDGNLTPTSREYVKATGVSGASFSGLTRNSDGSGSDQEHAVGAIVEFVPTVGWAGSILTAVDDVIDDVATNTSDISTNSSSITALEALEDGAISITLDGGGSVPETGVALDIEVPFDCTITSYTALADQSGSITVDLWKDTYANFPPTNDDSITASAPVALSSAIKAQDSTLTGWTTSVTAGDIIRVNIDSVTTITRLTISLNITR